MTESEWLASTDPETMLWFAQQNWMLRDDRDNLRLFACACCRELQPLLADERSHHAIEVAERFADGWVTAEELLRRGIDVVTARSILLRDRWPAETFTWPGSRVEAPRD